MTEYTTTEAKLDLATIERRRREVMEEVGVPHWYWWGLALGWLGLGLLIDMGHPWISAAGTLVFGAVHAIAFGAVGDGRRRTSRLRIRRELVGRRVMFTLLSALLGLTALTIAASVVAGMDGARHPVTMASVLVGATVLLGGPSLMRRIQRAGGRSYE